jgi:hypothetical protein
VDWHALSTSNGADSLEAIEQKGTMRAMGVSERDSLALALTESGYPTQQCSEMTPVVAFAAIHPQRELRHSETHGDSNAAIYVLSAQIFLQHR